MINYDTDRGVKVTKDGAGYTMSLKNAGPDDSGNYTCSPYKIRAASVLVHVLSEGNSAAQLSNSAVSSADQASGKGNKNTGSVDHTKQITNNRQSPPSAAVHSGGVSISKRVGIASVILAVLLWTS